MRSFILTLAALAGFVACTSVPTELSVNPGNSWQSSRKYDNFVISGEVCTPEGGQAVLSICQTSGNEGYEILFHGGSMDGTLKTGSLMHVRNLYHTNTKEGEWFPFEVAVRGKNISVDVAGHPVVCYTEPENPWRSDEHKGQKIASGRVGIKGLENTVNFRGLAIQALPAEA